VTRVRHVKQPRSFRQLETGKGRVLNRWAISTLVFCLGADLIVASAGLAAHLSYWLVLALSPLGIIAAALVLGAVMVLYLVVRGKFLIRRISAESRIDAESRKAPL
jgi:hypothetical protein